MEDKNMKNTSLFIVLAMLLLACSSSPTDKATALIKEDMPKNLIKADSYDPVDTKVDSAFAPYDSPTFYTQVMEYLKLESEMDACERKTRYAKSSMAIYSSPYDASSRNEYQEYKAEYEACMEQQKSLEEKIREKVEYIKNAIQEKPKFIGFKAYHRFRSDNNAGQTLLGGALYILNEDITQILALYDVESEDYIKYQQIIKQLQEE